MAGDRVWKPPRKPSPINVFLRACSADDLGLLLALLGLDILMAFPALCWLPEALEYLLVFPMSCLESSFKSSSTVWAPVDWWW